MIDLKKLVFNLRVRGSNLCSGRSIADIDKHLMIQVNDLEYSFFRDEPFQH